MIGKTISHYKIVEKLIESDLTMLQWELRLVEPNHQASTLLLGDSI